MKAIAFDPGGTTGIAYYIDGKIVCKSEGPLPHHIDIYGWLRSELWDFVFYEKFIYQKRPDAPSVDLSACEYIGVIKLWAAEEAHVEVHSQGPSEAKSFWTDDKLKRVEVHQLAHNKHERDALRHLLAGFMKNCPQVAKPYIEMLRTV